MGFAKSDIGTSIYVAGEGYFNPTGYNDRGEWNYDERDFTEELENARFFVDDTEVYRIAHQLSQEYPSNEITLTSAVVTITELETLYLGDLHISQGQIAKSIKGFVNKIGALSFEETEALDEKVWKKYKAAKKLLS